MTAARGPRLPYSPALDGLRAISVVVVMLWHHNPADGLVPGGFLGVEIFFVISGYLITSLLLVESAAHGRISLRNFYARRARRLLPALFVLLAVVSAYSIVFLRSDAQPLGPDLLAALTYTSNWSLIVRHVSYFGALGRPPLLQHLWSLAVEEQFYLVWPIAFITLTRVFRGRRRPMFATLVTLAAASAAWMWVLYDPFADPSRVYFGTDTRACGLLLGAAFALAWRPTRLTTRTGARAPALLDGAGGCALAVLAAFFLFTRNTDAYLYHGGFALVALVTLVVIGVAVHPASRIMHGFLGARPLRWIGVRSYGLYLWHWPIFMVTRPRVDVPLRGATLLLFRLALTTLAASLSYRFVEQPVRTGSLIHLRERARTTRADWAAAGLTRRVQAGIAAFIIAVVALCDVVLSLSSRSHAAVGSTLSRTDPLRLPMGPPLPVSGSRGPPPAPKVALPRRVVIVGDSVAHFAYANRPDGLAPYFTITDGSIEGCGVLEGRMSSSIGYRRDLGAECHGWAAKWAKAARAAHAQIALVFIGAWEVFDIEARGRTMRFGTPAWDRYFDAQLGKGIRALETTGAQVALEEIPCWRPVDNGSGTTAFPERGDDRRTRHLNLLLRRAAAADPDRVVALSAPPQYCTDPAIATSLAERWDGVHYGRPGAARLFTRLTPQLLAIPLVTSR